MIIRQTSHTIITEIPLKKRLETGLSLFGHLQIAVFLRFEPLTRKPQIQRNVKQNRDLRSEYRQTSKFVYGFLDCSVAHQATCSFRGSPQVRLGDRCAEAVIFLPVAQQTCIFSRYPRLASHLGQP